MKKYKIVYECNVIFEKEIEVNSEKEALNIAKANIPLKDNFCNIKTIESPHNLEVFYVDK